MDQFSINHWIEELFDICGLHSNNVDRMLFLNQYDKDKVIGKKIEMTFHFDLSMEEYERIENYVEDAKARLEEKKENG